jgi:hypothetical protein
MSVKAAIARKAKRDNFTPTYLPAVIIRPSGIIHIIAKKCEAGEDLSINLHQRFELIAGLVDRTTWTQINASLIRNKMLKSNGAEKAKAFKAATAVELQEP